MFRLKIIAVVGGAMLAYFGIQEFRVSQGTSLEPFSVNLAELESGSTSENNHVRIGEHIAVYPGSVYQYRQAKYEQGPPGPSTSLDYVYYPVISGDHSFFAELEKLAEKYGNVDSAPDAEWPSIDTFSVIVKTKRFKTIGAIPEGLGSEESVQGLVINMIGGLDSEEEVLLHESFPKVDVEKVLIVEDGREPASALKSLGMTVGGGLLALLGVGGFLMGRNGAA